MTVNVVISCKQFDLEEPQDDARGKDRQECMQEALAQRVFGDCHEHAPWHRCSVCSAARHGARRSEIRGRGSCNEMDFWSVLLRNDVHVNLFFYARALKHVRFGEVIFSARRSRSAGKPFGETFVF